MRVSLDEIEAVATAAMERAGATRGVAASVANAVRVAESRGNKICGLYYLESYCVQLESGRVIGDAEPIVHVDRPSAVRVDGRLGFAQPAFAAGFELAVDAARTNGVCGYSVEHTHTATAVGYFTEQFAREGLLAIGCTNATARVAPPGGAMRLLGTNPMAMAVPDGDGDVAFQFDFSTSAVALGTITMASAAGESIPLGWAVDGEGQPTTDPDAALSGSLSPAGGHKGFGLGLMVELLAAGLTGGRSSVDVPPLKARDGAPHDLGQFYVVIDPGAFERGHFDAIVAGLIAAVSEDGSARLPGTRASQSAEVEIEDDVWAATLALAGR